MRPFKRSLVEDFQGMGLSDRAVQDSLSNMLGEDEDGFDDELDDFEVEDVDALNIVEAMKKIKKLRGKEKMKAVWYRRSAMGKKSAKKQARLHRLGSYKKKAAKRRKKLARAGGPKKGFRRVVSSRDYEGGSLTEALIENLQELSESVDYDGGERFDQYVEAFNHIADLGELMALRYNEMGEEDLAEDVIGIAILAEEVLEEMEDFGGVVDLDEDENLEEALSEAMEIVGDQLAEYSEITENEDYDDDDDEDDELAEALAVLEAARSRKEKGYVVTTREKKSMGRGRKAKTVTRKRTIGHGKSGKGEFTDQEGVSYGMKDLDTFEKKLVYNRDAEGQSKSTKIRKDIKDPKGLAGYLARQGSFRR